MAGFISSIPKAGRKLHIPRIPYFLIFYSTTFTFLLILFFALLLIPFADSIQQCVENKAYFNIFIMGGVYLLTAILSLFIYASRLYKFRTSLASIPKSYIPIEKGDLPRRVRAVILDNLARSDRVAHSSTPRDLSAEEETPIQDPIWGHIEHPGFSAPAIRQNPGQLPPHTRFEAVIAELPHLIEARAVSLLPSPAPAELLELLQRPAAMGLREYFLQLREVGLIDGPAAGQFLHLYERSRFSADPLSQADFETLMEAFAEVLRGVVERGPDMLKELDVVFDEGNDENDSDDGLPGEDGSLESMDEEGSIDSERVDDLSFESRSGRSVDSFDSDGTTRITPKKRRSKPRNVTPKPPTSKGGRTPVSASFRPTPVRKGSEISMTGEGSRIRLRKRDEEGDETALPYAYVEASSPPSAAK